jgi:ectoine hydroxylase-related dioxygenase (phytanoyl-CoA dioxygenase family)
MEEAIESHAEAYEREGFIRVPELYNEHKVKEVRTEVERYIRESLDSLPEGDYVLEADGKSVRNLWRMDEHSTYFEQLAHDPGLLVLLERLLHGEPELSGVETFNKPAKTGSGVPPHQDNAYFCKRPPDMLTVWIALDPVTEENGPVNYVAGSHRDGLRPHEASGVKGNSMKMAGELPAGQRVAPGLLNAGDALIHHCETIHFSEPNHSDRPRLGLLMVYRGKHTQTDPDLKAAYDAGRQNVS